MTINWLGYSCFKIQGKNVAVLIDPFSPEIGFKLGKQNVELVLISHDHKFHNYRDSLGETPLIFDTPGEYEAKGVFIYGIPSWHDKKDGAEKGSNIIFRIEMEGISVVHLGDLGHGLSLEQKERLNGVDILLVPVGGQDTLNYKEAAELISELEPKIVIPMHYQIDGQKTKLEGVEKFAKEMAVSPKAELDKLKITQKELPVDEEKVIILAKA